VPVQPRALVPGRHVGQTMRCLELEDLEDVHVVSPESEKPAHGAETSAGRMVVWVHSNKGHQPLVLHGFWKLDNDTYRQSYRRMCQPKFSELIGHCNGWCLRRPSTPLRASTGQFDSLREWAPLKGGEFSKR
jgi:hypothetical protein